MKQKQLTSGLVGIAFLLLAIAPGNAAEPTFSWTSNAVSFGLEADGKTVWRFNYGTNKATKPYFHPVALPGGEPLTWESPADHVWHYGLWFSWKYLNDVNYWEENKQGQSDGVTSWKIVKFEPRPDYSARIVLDLDYRARGADHAVLKERRVLEISRPGRDGSYFIDWRLEFQAGNTDVKFDRTPLPGEPGGQIFGGYAGLSLRFAKNLTDPQVAASSDPGQAKDSRYRFSAAAADYNGRLGGTEVGVAILDHPANPRHPTRWYAIVNPRQSFWFLNAAWIQLKPYESPANEKLKLSYRVVVHPDRWDATDLNAARQKYR